MARPRRSRVPKYCAVCGSPREREDRFCGTCGADLAKVDAGEIGPEESETVVAPAAPASPPQPSGPPPPSPPPTPAPPPAAPAAAAPPQVVYVPTPSPAPTQHAPAPPAPPAARGQGVFDVRMAGVGLTVRLLPLVGAVGVVASSWLDWTGKASAWDLPFDFIFDYKNATGDFKLGLVVLLVGIAGGVLSLFPGTNPIRRIAGLAAMAIGVAFAIQIGIAIDDTGRDAGDFFDLVEAGFYVCLGGGFLVATQR